MDRTLNLALTPLLALVCLACTVGAAEPAPVRLAVVAGRADIEATADLLSVRLSQQEGVELLDRADVRRLLAEQALTASGLASPEGVQELGRLLAVDLFVFADLAPVAREGVLGVRFVEARTGIVLGDLLVVQKQIEADLDKVEAGLAAALRRHGVRDEDRLFVGLLGFDAEEPGPGLRGAAAALEALVAADLARADRIILLDRTRLQHLVEERDLAGSELALHTSAVLISGGLRHATDRTRYRIVVNFRRLDGATIEPAICETAADDMPQTRAAIGEAILARLSVQPPADAPSDPKTEAAAFTRRIELLAGTYMTNRGLDIFWLLRQRRTDPAEWVSFAEAAYALEPTQERLATIAKGAADPRGRAATLLFWRNEVDDLRRKGVEVTIPHIGFPAPGNTGPGPDGDPREEIEMERETLALALAYYARVGQFDDWYSNLSSGMTAMGRWSTDTAEWGANLRDMVSILLHPPEGGQDRRAAFGVMSSMSISLFAGRRHFDPFVHPEQSGQLEKTLEWMRQQEDDMLALHSYYMQLRRFKRGGDFESSMEPTARRLLDYAGVHFPVDHPDRVAGQETYFRSMVLEALELVGTPDRKGEVEAETWAERGRYLRPFVDPLLERGEARRLAWWLAYPIPRKSVCAEVMRHCTPRDEALLWLERARKLLAESPETQSAPRGSLATYARECIAALDGHIDSLKEEKSPTPVEVQELAVTPLPSGTPPAGMEMLAAVHRQHDQLYLAWGSCRSQEQTATLCVTRMPLEGGPQTLVARAEIHPDVEAVYERLKYLDDQDFRRRAALLQVTSDWCGNTAIREMAVIGGDIYIGTRKDGIVACRAGKAEVWDHRNRLPASCVRSLAAHRGKLYFWLSSDEHGASEGALYCYDPDDDTLTTCISTRAVEPRNALDGGPPYVIEGILGDETRNCLWLGVTRGGLWQYDLASGQASCQTAFKDRPVGYLDWRDGRILAGKENNRFTFCLSLWAPGLDASLSLYGWGWPPVFVQEQRRCWPAAIFDNWFLACNKTWRGRPPVGRYGKKLPPSSGLDLYTSSTHLPTPLPATPGGPNHIEYLIQVTPEEAIVANEEGQFWKIRRPTDQTPAATILPWTAAQRAWDSQANGSPELIKPSGVTASGELPDSPAQAVNDGKIRTRWGVAADAAQPAWLEFTFAVPEQVAEIVLLNGWIPADDKFMAYGIQHRVKALRIAFDDRPGQVFRVHDLNCPQAIRCADSPPARRVRLTVEETYPAETAVADAPPRLSLSEVAFRRAREGGETSETTVTAEAERSRYYD